MYLGSIVLAGGDSSRMGRPKAALPLHGSTVLGRTVDMLLLCSHPVVIVARDEQQELPPYSLEAEVVFDDEPGQGPLMGIASGLRAVEGQCDAVFVAACDAPFLDQKAVGWVADQLGDHDLVIPRSNGLLQPLAAVYRCSVLPTIDALIAEGERTPRSLAERVNTRILEEVDLDAFDPGRRFLRNINTVEEYEAILREFGDQGA